MMLNLTTPLKPWTRLSVFSRFDASKVSIFNLVLARWLALIAGAALLALIPTAAQAQTSKRVALLIGNASYTVGRLTNPPNDVREMESALKSVGFSVQIVQNANQNAMKRAVRDFGNSAQGADIAFFYYSGHGTQANGENYLIPVQASIDKDADYEVEAVSANSVMRQLANARPKAAIVVLDACRDNPLAATTKSTAKGLGRMEAPTGTMVAFATAPNTTASDEGLYARALARQIRTPGLELIDVFRNTTAEVIRATGGKQEPRINEMSITDRIYLSGERAQTASVRPAMPEAVAPAFLPLPANPKPQPLKAAWVYVGPVGDAGWTYAHDLGRKAVEAEFGDKVKTSFVENVPEGADAERVIRDLAKQGNKVIFATSFGYMEPMHKVVKDFPDVRFEHATGYKVADNMRTYDTRFYQGSYIAGVIAGRMSRTGTLGFVGSFPIPEVLRNINAYTLGAQSVNPNIKTRVVWVNSWFDPIKESEAAQTLINGGADVLLQNTDSTAVLQTAEKAGKYAFGWDSDMSAFAPRAHLGSAIGDWSNYYKKSIKEAIDGSWKGNVGSWWGVKEGQNNVIKIAGVVPAETKARVEEIKAGMRSSTFEVFTGPITDNAGRERLARGVKAGDEWMGKVDFYVRGVEGKIPNGK